MKEFSILVESVDACLVSRYNRVTMLEDWWDASGGHIIDVVFGICDE